MVGMGMGTTGTKPTSFLGSGGYTYSDEDKKNALWDALINMGNSMLSAPSTTRLPQGMTPLWQGIGAGSQGFSQGLDTTRNMKLDRVTKGMTMAENLSKSRDPRMRAMGQKMTGDLMPEWSRLSGIPMPSADSMSSMPGMDATPSYQKLLDEATNRFKGFETDAPAYTSEINRAVNTGFNNYEFPDEQSKQNALSDYLKTTAEPLNKKREGFNYNQALALQDLIKNYPEVAPSDTETQVRRLLTQESGKEGQDYLTKMTEMANKEAYKEREFPLANGKVQKQVSSDNGKTWTPMGEPYDRHQPFDMKMMGMFATGENAFKNWPDDVKEEAYRNKLLNKETPTFGARDAESKAGFTRGYNGWLAKNGITAQDVASGRGAVKFQQSQGTMQTNALLSTIDPLLDKLEKAGAVLGNSSVPFYNTVANYAKEKTGSSDIVGFNNLRDDVVAEVERGLFGTGVLSDSKYQRALKNVNSAQSFPQLQAAIANMRIVINARLEANKTASTPNIPGFSGNGGMKTNGSVKSANDFLNKWGK